MKLQKTLVFKNDNVRLEVTVCLAPLSEAVRHRGKEGTYLQIWVTDGVTAANPMHSNRSTGMETFRREFGQDPKARFLLDTYDRWNDNHYRAGTPAQMEAMRDFVYDPQSPFYVANNHHKSAIKFLRSRKLAEDQGYRYGSSWLYEEIPTTVLEQLQAL